MRKTLLAMTSAAALLVAGCAGGEAEDAEATDSEATTEAPAEEAAAYDPVSEEGMAYRAAVECSGTMHASSDLRGAQGIFVETDEEREAIRGEEEERDARAEAIAAVAIERGEALGLTSADVEAEIEAHQGTFVQTPEDGTMEEFTARVMGDADTCAADYDAG